MQALKRKRSRLACNPCRERKRKCDGNAPCTTCVEWGYDCHYKDRRSAKQPTPDAHPISQSSPQNGASQSVESDQSGLMRRLEANSGAAFVRKLGLKIDPAKAPKLNLFGWNIGTRQLSSQVINPTILSVFEITSLEHITSLAHVYFNKVDPCYGFINKNNFFERLNTRWISHSSSDVYDSVLCGVAAIGCLFSQRNASVTELRLVRSARSTLDMLDLVGPPSVDLITGWALRAMYLRFTDSPHSTWIASSTLMHLVEASGLHPEPPNDSVLPHNYQFDPDPDIQRRLVGIAHHLNIWTSYDLGLSRVSFQKQDLPLLPSPKPGDYTGELLNLLPMSLDLDPGKLRDETDLNSTLSTLLNGSHTRPPSVLAQCNLVLCILRRIHTQNLDISSTLAGKVLSLLKKALGCARSMALDCSPWHQIANVPFHIICVLLVIDTRMSLAMLPEAMQTLSLVASTYDTETMREAYSAACLLVMLHQQRRRDDIAILEEALSGPRQEQQFVSPPQFQPSAEEYSWLGALVADLPGLQRIDLDQFLNSDMIDGPSFLGG